MADKSPSQAAVDDGTPTIVILVTGGIADIRGVNGKMRVHLIDGDQPDELLSQEQIETRLKPAVLTGSADEVVVALGEARECLEHWRADPDHMAKP